MPATDKSRAGTNVKMDSKTEVGMERRAFSLEIRAADPAEDKPRQIVGHAAVFDTITDLGWFKERVAKGAFTESIGQDDIRALFNHDPNFVLGRNKAGTLRLNEDAQGLYFEADLPDTQAANDLYTSIQRGDITQCSFGFVVLDASWDTVDGEEVRTLKRVQLWDVSPVTFPAYPTTDASTRAQLENVWSQRANGRETIGQPNADDARQGADAEQGLRERMRMRLELAQRS